MEPRTVVDWDNYWLQHAILAATKSKDPSTQVGCVIVSQDNQLLTTGFNGFPRGVNELDPERWERPVKYSYVEHAERNAVYNAARYGIALKGSKAYLNWTPNPCEGCARALIQAGIVEVIGTDVPFAGKGKGTFYDVDVGSDMFKENGIIQRIVVGFLK